MDTVSLFSLFLETQIMYRVLKQPSRAMALRVQGPKVSHEVGGTTRGVVDDPAYSCISWYTALRSTLATRMLGRCITITTSEPALYPFKVDLDIIPAAGEAAMQHKPERDTSQSLPVWISRYQ